MSGSKKIVWSEGMFLRPQHFQQHDRYLERLVESRAGMLRPHAYGVTELTIDQQALSLGKLSVASARGVMPDGTPFDFPGSDEPPAPLDLPRTWTRSRCCSPCRCGVRGWLRPCATKIL